MEQLMSERKPPPPGKNPFWTADMGGPPAVRSRQSEAVERVARELGASPAEAAKAAKETQPMTRAQAAQELGVPEALERARQRLPYECGKELMRFRTIAGRRRLVSMLAKELSDDDTALSSDILEAIGYLLEEDARHVPDARPITSVADAKFEYVRMLRVVREGEA